MLGHARRLRCARSSRRRARRPPLRCSTAWNNEPSGARGGVGGRAERRPVVPQPRAHRRRHDLRRQVAELLVGARAARLAGRARSAAARGGGGMSVMTTIRATSSSRPWCRRRATTLIASDRYSFRCTRTPTRRRCVRPSRSSSACSVDAVNIIKVQAKPKRRGLFRGTRPGYKKAIIQLAPGETIELFEGSRANGTPLSSSPTSPGPSLHDDLRFRRGHDSDKPEKSLLAPVHRHRRAQQQRPHHDAPPAAAATSAATASSTSSGARTACPPRWPSIEYDPNRSARIALLHYVDGAKAYILAPQRLEVGTMLTRAPTPTSRSATACR